MPVMMQVGFYGLRAAVQEHPVRDRCQHPARARERRVRAGSDAQAVRAGAGGVPSDDACHRDRQRHRRDLAGVDGDGHRPGRRGHHPSQHVLRHGRSHLDRRSDCSVRRLRSEHEVHRPRQDRGGDHAQDEGHHPRASLWSVRRYASNQENCRRTQPARDRGQRAGHRRRRRWFHDRPVERRDLRQLHHSEEPRHVW